jgi:hypothetical protein
VEQYREAAAELDALRAQLAAAQTQIGTLETQVVRADVRVATGVDDDDVADLLHRRYRREIEGQDAPPPLDQWWGQIKGDEAKRAALPLGLRAYAQPAQTQAPAPPRRPGTRLPGTTPPRPGRAQMTADDFGRLDGKGQVDAMRAFFGGRRLT